MKLFCLQIILAFGIFVGFCSPLHAADASLSYAPDVVTLTGTISRESYGDDPPSPRYRGQYAWILRLDKPISIRRSSGNEEAANVKEIALNIDRAKHPVSKRAFNKTRFVVTGTLYRPGTTYFLRSVAMSVSALRPTLHQ